MIELLEKFRIPASTKVQQDLTPEFYFDEAAFEAEFNTPEEQERVISISMRMAVAVGGLALAMATVIGYEAGQPDQDQPEISAEKIERDLNKNDPKDRTSKPIAFMKGYELVIPKLKPEDPSISAKIPVQLGNDRYGVFEFDEDSNDCEAEILEIESAAAPEPIKGERAEVVVFPVSVVYTEIPHKNGKTEKVCSVVEGDESGNAADVVKIDSDQASLEQKRLLKDKTFRKLAETTFGMASQKRVGYLDIAS